MFTDFLFLGLNSGVSANGKPFNVCSLAIPRKDGGYDAKTSFLQDDVLVDKVKGLTPLKTYKGNIVFAKGENNKQITILVTID